VPHRGVADRIRDLALAGEGVCDAAGRHLSERLTEPLEFQ